MANVQPQDILPALAENLYQAIFEIFLEDGDSEGHRDDFDRPLCHDSIDAMLTTLEEISAVWQDLQLNGQTSQLDFSDIDANVRIISSAWKDPRRKNLAFRTAKAVSLAVESCAHWTGPVTILTHPGQHRVSFLERSIPVMIQLINGMAQGANRSAALITLGIAKALEQLTWLENISKAQQPQHAFQAPGQANQTAAPAAAQPPLPPRARLTVNGRAVRAQPPPPPPPPPPAPPANRGNTGARGRGARGQGARGRGGGRGGAAAAVAAAAAAAPTPGQGNNGPAGHGRPEWSINDSITLLQHSERNWDQESRIERARSHHRSTGIDRTWQSMRQQLRKLRDAGWDSQRMTNAQNSGIAITW